MFEYENPVSFSHLWIFAYFCFGILNCKPLGNSWISFVVGKIGELGCLVCEFCENFLLIYPGLDNRCQIHWYAVDGSEIRRYL